MKVSRTVHIAGGGKRKQLTLRSWLISFLSESDATKGVTSYEALAFSGHIEDELTPIVERSIDRLESETVGDVRDAIDGYVSDRIDTARDDLIETCKYENPESKEDNASLYLPEECMDALSGWGLGRDIEQAVLELYASPWSDRFEQVEDLEALTEFASTGTVPDGASDFVSRVANGEVARLSELIDPEKEWWETDDLTMEELRERGTEVKQRMDARVSALETALNNDDLNYSYDGVVVQAKTVYDVQDEAARRYADNVELENTSVHLDVEQKMDELATLAMSSDERAADRKKYKVAGFNLNPSDIGITDDEYPTPEDGLEAIDELRDNISNKKDVPEFVDKNRNRLKSWLDDKEEGFQEAKDDE